MMYNGEPVSKADLIVYSNVSDPTLPSTPAPHEEVRFSPKIITVVAMLSVFSVVGVVGNAIAFYIFFRRRNSSTSVVFILALAGTDFITCLVTIPYTIVHELLSYRLVYDVACKTYMFLITSTVPFSAYIMVGIGLDRYFCICHPFLYAVTIPRAKAIIFGMGLPALTFGVMTALMFGTYIYQEKTVANVTQLLNVSDTHLSHHEIISMLYKQLENHPSTPGLTLDSIYIMSGKTVDDSSSSPTNYTMIRYVEHIKQCVRNYFVFSESFVNFYTKVHAAGFVLAYLIVAILYILIYKSIYTRRANKAKRKKNDIYPPLAVGTKIEETQMSVLNGNGQANTLNNQQKLVSEHVGARKITLTAKNDAGLHQSNSVSGPDQNDNHNEDKKTFLTKTDDDGQGTRENTAVGNNNGDVNFNSQDCDLYNKTEGKDKVNDKIQQEENFHTINHRNNATYSNLGVVPTSAGNNDDDKSDDERGECSSNVPLLKPVLITRDRHGRATSNNFALCVQTSTSCKIDDPANLTPLSANHDLSRSCPSLSPPAENPKPVSKDAKISPTHLSASAAVSPVVSPPKSLPIKITFNSAKSSETTKPKPKHLQTDAQTNSIKRKRQSTLRHRNLVANIKTAFMLFIVTLVFLIAFLPALLMANDVIPLNLIFFYFHHIYNVVNPFIYAFMNQTFREDLKKIGIVLCSR